jgi:hypothetical protein
MSGLNCHSCGASCSPDGGTYFVDCEYCGASISVAEFFKQSSSDTLAALSDAGLSDEESKTISRLFEGAEHHLQISEYEMAQRNFEEILKIYPRHIPSRLNLANCLLFDPKSEPIERAKRVKEHVLNANSGHEEIPEITALKQSIAFNVASMGSRLSNGMDSIEMFSISEEIAENNVDRDKLVEKFFESLYPKIGGRIESGLKQDKKEFSPSGTDLTIMIAGSKYLETYRNLCSKMYRHLNLNQRHVHKKSTDYLDRLKECAGSQNASEVATSSNRSWVSILIAALVVCLVSWYALS